MKRTLKLHARLARFAGGLVACGLAAVLAQGGCAESEPISFVLEPPDAGSMVSTGGTDATGGQNGTGGMVGTGGEPGTGGALGTGGTTGTGGVTGTGGITGSGGTRATGGTQGMGGTKATGGTTGTGGVLGTGGMKAAGGTTGAGGMKATGGTTGAGGAGGSAPTFTEVYQMILSVSCTGSQCHNPGSQGGVSFSSQSTAYSSVKNRVSAGNANGSSLYTLVKNGQMPPTGTKLNSTQLSLISGWINAGAMNN